MPWWLWPNMLSLDAPLIAASWQNLFASSADVHLTIASRVALPLAVWLIYLSDRLLDTRQGMLPQLSARHAFCRANRGLCSILLVIASCFLSLSALYIPHPVVRTGFALSGLVAIYFLVVHYTGGRWRARLPKELVVGFVFVGGTVLAPWMRSANSWRLLFPALLFCVLCWVNCSAIEAWENGFVHPLSRWIVHHVKPVTLAIALLCLPLSLSQPAHHLALALFVAALGFAGIAEKRINLKPDALRVWLDVPLLAPLLLINLR